MIRAQITEQSSPSSSDFCRPAEKFTQAMAIVSKSYILERTDKETRERTMPVGRHLSTSRNFQKIVIFRSCPLTLYGSVLHWCKCELCVYFSQYFFDFYGGMKCKKSSCKNIWILFNFVHCRETRKRERGGGVRTSKGGKEGTDSDSSQNYLMCTSHLLIPGAFPKL